MFERDFVHPFSPFSAIHATRLRSYLDKSAVCGCPLASSFGNELGQRQSVNRTLQARSAVFAVSQFVFAVFRENLCISSTPVGIDFNRMTICATHGTFDHEKRDERNVY